MKVTLQVTHKDPTGADSTWYTVKTDSANAGFPEVITFGDAANGMWGYRILLDDVEGAATRIVVIEHFQYTRGGRGWEAECGWRAASRERGGGAGRRDA